MTCDIPRNLRAEYMAQLDSSLRAMTAKLDWQAWDRLRPELDSVWQAVGALESCDRIDAKERAMETAARNYEFSDGNVRS